MANRVNISTVGMTNVGVMSNEMNQPTNQLLQCGRARKTGLTTGAHSPNLWVTRYWLVKLVKVALVKVTNDLLINLASDQGLVSALVLLDLHSVKHFRPISPSDQNQFVHVNNYQSLCTN